MNDASTTADDPSGDLDGVAPSSRTLSAASIAAIVVISVVVGAVVFVVGAATVSTEVVSGVTISLGRADASNSFNSQKVDDVRGLLRSRPILDAVSAETGVARSTLRSGLAIGNVRDGRVLDITYTARRGADREGVLVATVTALGDTLATIEVNELSTSVEVLEARLADTVAEIAALGQDVGVDSIADEFALLDDQLSELITQEAVAIRLGSEDVAELTRRIGDVRVEWNEVAQSMERYRFLDRQRNVLIDDLERIRTRLGEARVDNGTVIPVGGVTGRGTVDGSRQVLQAAAIAAGATGVLSALAAMFLPSVRRRVVADDSDDDLELDPQLV